MSRIMVNHYLRVLRELIFETIRERSFPHLISRWGCIWVIPSKRSLGFWIKNLGITDLSQCRVYKVKCTGEIHRGHEKHLQVESMSVPTIEKNAMKYWTGVGKDQSDEDEVIFCEKIEFIEIINHLKKSAIWNILFPQQLFAFFFSLNLSLTFSSNSSNIELSKEK